jgi:hypothetical protein
MATVADKYHLHLMPDAFLFEPVTTEPAHLLEIERATGTFSLKTPRPGSFRSSEGIEEIFGLIGIIRLLAGPYLVVITARKRVGRLLGCDVWRVTGTKLLPFVKGRLHTERQRDEERYLALLQSILKGGHLYYSTHYDLTHRAQKQHALRDDHQDKPMWERADQRFFWNRYLAQDFISSQLDGWVTPVMLGYVQIESHCTVNGHRFDYALISRRHTKRAGTRYHIRGADEQGHVANFVETEQVLVVPAQDRIYSFVQTRGSIPVFWSQAPDITYKPKPRLTATEKRNTAAFKAHMDELKRHYSQHVLINLINQKGAEAVIGKEYEKQVQLYGDESVKYVWFDFHHECRKMRFENVSNLIQQVKSDIDKFGYFLTENNEVLRKQEGIFRTNCIDNLDRTNVVQSTLAREVLNAQLLHAGIFQRSSESIADHPAFRQVFNHVWANNADAISEQYAGTGALKTDYTRTGKRSLKGVLNDGLNSATRYYLNNFKDGFRQDAYDLFLGNYVVGQSSRSPFAHNYRPVATTLFVIALLIGAVMLLASVLAPMLQPHGTQSILYQFTVIVFWVVAMLGSYKVLKLYGRDLVDRPQLVPIPHIHP